MHLLVTTALVGCFCGTPFPTSGLWACCLLGDSGRKRTALRADVISEKCPYPGAWARGVYVGKAGQPSMVGLPGV